VGTGAHGGAASALSEPASLLAPATRAAIWSLTVWSASTAIVSVNEANGADAVAVRIVEHQTLLVVGMKLRHDRSMSRERSTIRASPSPWLTV
jgi:hypothetical protein